MFSVLLSLDVLLDDGIHLQPPLPPTQFTRIPPDGFLLGERWWHPIHIFEPFYYSFIIQRRC